MRSRRARLARLAAELRPGLPLPPGGFSLILTDEDADRHAAWVASLPDDQHAALHASGRIVAVDFRPAPSAP